MIGNLQRPILVGGATLAIALWFLDTLSHTVGELGLYALVAGAIGAGVWWLQKPSQPTRAIVPKRVDRALVKRALGDAETLISQLASESDAATIVQPQLSTFQAQMAQIASEMQRDSLRVLIMGAKGTGKSTLLQRLADWATAQALTLSEASSFAGTSVTGLTADTALQQALNADLLLYLVTGDLTESELQTIGQLAGRKRVVLVFNKQDHYLPDEQQVILTRMQARMQALPVTVVAIAAAPKPIKVRQHQADGTVNEWTETPAPDLAALMQPLDRIVQQERQQLVMASSLSSAEILKSDIKTALNAARRVRALPIVEKFQWISAAAAFASPLPTIDVIAAAAINAQMIVDLGAIYRQKFSLQQAQKITVILGTLILKLGLVELSTRTIASLLKTNAVTYVAGGCAQGVSAAYLTRVAGLSLIEYFHSQEPYLTETEAQPLAIERFSQILQTVFQQNQQLAFLQSFVSQTIDRILPTPAAPIPAAATVNHPASVRLSATSLGPN